MSRIEIESFEYEDVLDSRELQCLLVECLLDEHEKSGEHADRMQAIRDLRDEVGVEWPHGVAFIRDDYFERYAREVAEDIGAISHGMGWPHCHIDWAAAAQALQEDYSSCEILGVTYWYRA